MSLRPPMSMRPPMSRPPMPFLIPRPCRLGCASTGPLGLAGCSGYPPWPHTACNFSASSHRRGALALFFISAGRGLRLPRLVRCCCSAAPVPLAPWARFVLGCHAPYLAVFGSRRFSCHCRSVFRCLCRASPLSVRADLLVVVRVVSESVSEYRLQPSPAVRVRPCFDARAGAEYVWL